MLWTKRQRTELTPEDLIYFPNWSHKRNSFSVLLDTFYFDKLRGYLSSRGETPEFEYACALTYSGTNFTGLFDVTDYSKGVFTTSVFSEFSVVIKSKKLLQIDRVVHVHNHPGGNTHPSNRDLIGKQKIKELLLPQGIDLWESYIYTFDKLVRY